ncbi:30S ribosomal protein S18 [Candidatus Microgenomates bacterium]|nr:30S ribosomal protein S18 [Candidatus Microgenomates bacterium]
MYKKVFKKRPIRQVCYFCENKTLPDFKADEVLRRFISERGKILDRSKTGTCAKHQRRLTIAVKRARHLSLLPFVARI